MSAALVASLTGRIAEGSDSWGELILWAVLSGLALGAVWRVSLRAFSWRERRDARHLARTLIERSRANVLPRLVPQWRQELAAESDEGRRRELTEGMVAKVRKAFGDELAEQVRAALAGPANPA